MEGWTTLWVGVAAGVVATSLVGIVVWAIRPRLRVRAGYSDPGFSSVVFGVKNMSLRWVVLDEMGLLVDGKAAPLTPRGFDPNSANSAYQLVRLRPLASSSLALPPTEVERRVALVLMHGFHTGIDLRGYAKAGDRTFLARETFTW